MTNDTHITYTNEGLPISITIDGKTYTPEELRQIIASAAALRAAEPGDHPGSARLSELDTARALKDALAFYDAAAKARDG